MSSRVFRLSLLSVLVAMFLPSMVQAHHFLGLPHYKYGEDYPQIPYMEVLAQVGEWDLLFTHFPGFPEPGEAIRFKLYVHDRNTGEVFRQPLQAEVFRKRFLRSAAPAGEPLVIATGTGPERNDYKFYLTFPDPEAYEVRVHFPAETGVEVVPFQVTVGATDDRPLIYGAAGVLGLAILGVAATKRRRRAAVVRPT